MKTASLRDYIFYWVFQTMREAENPEEMETAIRIAAFTEDIGDENRAHINYALTAYKSKYLNNETT